MPAFHVSVKGSGKDATVAVQEGDALAPWPADADLAAVGKPYSRREGRQKVTGRARYAYDVRMPRQLYARVLRSPHPHARIVQIDASKAEALSGVHAVLTVENAPEIPWYGDSQVFSRVLHCIGDEVAAVAAESEEVADDALRLIEVTYEPLPFVSDLEAAIGPGAPKAREDVEREGNLADDPKIYDRGDTESAFAQADIMVDRVFHTASAAHNSLEPHGATAYWDGENLTLYSSTQSVFTVRQQVAEALGLPEHHVRVIMEHMGGGFGAKQIAWKHDVLAALLSKQSGRPVQMMLDRRAENLAVGHRPSTHQRVQLAARRDGTLLGIRAEIAQARGAYLTGGEASNVSGMYQTLYRCENVHIEERSYHVNIGPAVAFRAPGHVEAAFALEQAMDELARALEMDPIALRRTNYAEVDQLSDKPFTLPEGLRLCYDAVAPEWESARRQRSAPDGTVRRGLGFAAHDWVGGGGHPPGYAWIELQEDGTANVITGTQDIGTGTRTGLSQVAAEALGLSVDRIAFRLGDTGTGPYAPVSSGSATQSTIGPAIRDAASEVVRQLLDAASTIMEIPASRLSVRENAILVDGDASRATPVEQITSQLGPHTIQGRGARTDNPASKSVRTFGAQFAEVDVDTTTGDVRVVRIVTAHDIGRIVNPTIVDSQIIGGVTQGVGFAMTEGQVIDHALGRVMNANLEEYKVPTVGDVPEIRHLHIDVADTEANSTGAKGVGEPPLVPTAPAIANAIYDAVGVRLDANPFSRRRLLDALAATGSSHQEEPGA